MASVANKEQFIKQLEQIVTGITQNKVKVSYKKISRSCNYHLFNCLQLCCKGRKEESR